MDLVNGFLDSNFIFLLVILATASDAIEVTAIIFHTDAVIKCFLIGYGPQFILK